NFDARGGSVASIETTLLEEGSYSNEVDGIVFAGGSTMGLAATDGVRKRIFDVRARQATEFDFIPSVPGAVVFDYGGRIHPKMDRYAYPDSKLGEKLMDNLSSDTFLVGRTGAGLNVTSSKISQPIWGGQGFKYLEFNGGIKIIVATVVNSGGNIILPDGKMLNQDLKSERNPDHDKISHLKPKPGQNTTLSIVITNVPLDRNALKRLSVMVHTSMAAVIRPFHTPTDGDILFAVSVPDNKLRASVDETGLALAASEMMAEAIIDAGRTSNMKKKSVKL
ncbi:MAG: P1 family peptidase, partial [Bdellovibrionales bacterium]|nr:P1 family peptidase [Bdellovibrionales bacterium]